MEHTDGIPENPIVQRSNDENEVKQTIDVNPAFTQELIGTTFKFDDLERNPGPHPLPILRMTPTFAACIRYMSRRSGISDGMLVGPFLACASTVLLPRVAMTTFYDKEIGVNIYCQTNAGSSSRKTDMFNPLLKQIIEYDSNRREHIRELNRKQSAIIKTWKLKLDAVKKHHAKASKQSDNDEAIFLEGQYQQILLEEPALLPALRILQSDVTPAAIILGLSENGGCGTFFIDEGVLLYQKIVSNEVHHINSSWSGAVIDKTTIRGGNIFIKNPRLSSHTFIQPDVFAKISRGKSFSFLKDTGYLTRVLICTPNVDPNTNVFPDYLGSVDELNKLLAHLKEQIAISYPMNGLFSGAKRILALSKEAEVLIKGFYDAIQIEIKPSGVFHEMLEFCGKIVEYVYRVAGILHCIEQHDTDEISYSTVSAAIVLIDWYATEHWRLIVKGGKPLTVEVGAEKLLHFLRFRHDRQTVPHVTLDDIRHRVECFHDDPAYQDDCLSYLYQRGDIEAKGFRRKGRHGGYRRYEIWLSEAFLKDERYRILNENRQRNKGGESN
jgi:hypothetical protein